MSSYSTVGSISSAGLGSGLDVNSIISKLMSIEQAPLTQLQTKASSIQATISAYGGIKSAVATFRDAASKLTLPGTWSATATTSSDPLTVSATSTPSAVAATYAVGITALAKGQSVATAAGAYASENALVGAGALTIEVGTYGPAIGNGTTPFTQKAGTSDAEVVTTSSDTLATLRDKINAASAGIVANIVTDANGSRLVMTSKDTGVDNAFRVKPSGALGGLSYVPDNNATDVAKRTQAAQNLAATINGLTVSSNGNTLDGVVQGLTLNAKKVGGPVQVTVGTDTASMKTAIKNFVDAYNSLNAALASDTKYDAASGNAAPLQGEGTAVSLQRQLRGILGSSLTSIDDLSGPASLSQIGLRIQTDGSIKIDDSVLTSAAAVPSDLKQLFSASTARTNGGFARRFQTLSDSVIGQDGLLSARVAGLGTSLSRNQKNQDSTTRHLSAIEAQLRAQYSALDSRMAGINALSTYVTQQIANWNKAK